MSDDVQVPVEIPGASYVVHVGEGLLGSAGELIAAVSKARRIALVTDTTVGELFGIGLASKLVTAGFEVFPLSVPPGEKSKSWATAGELVEAFAEEGIGREDLVVALGGGVIGDLAGFAAASYLRGVGFAQVPTTLLSQVDSSVGGKTGVDLAAGKNLAGAFKQPAIVIADISTLASLPGSEWASGLAEVAKSALIDSEGFTAWVETNSGALRARHEAAAQDAVVRSVTFKSKVVRTDERDEGVRECLNYGHTLGHAIENVAGYGAVPHGIAVAEGMRFAARLSVEVAGATREFVRRQDKLLDGLGLESLKAAYDPDDLLSAMHSDKKARGGRIRFVLSCEPGVWRCEAVSDETVREHLEAWAASKKGV